MTVASPQPTPSTTDVDKDRAQALFRRNHARGARSLGWRFEAYLQSGQRRQVLKAAQFAPGQRVLDVGAGLGDMVRAAVAAGARVTAVDAVPELVEGLRQDAHEAYVSDAETLDIEATFDCVLFIGVLEFVKNPKAALERLAQAVAPGGRFVLLVPTNTWAGQLYRLEKRLHGVRVHLFDAAWCQKVVTQMGLQVEQVSRPLPNNALMTFRRPDIH